MNNYSLLIKRLDAFIRKYYANKLLKGVMIFSASALAFYLMISIGEYFFYFNTPIRYALLIIFLLSGLGALIAWIILPLLQMQKLGKVINHKQAAEIIGSHFPNVKDKLLNILQLKEQENVKASQELIRASIEQKTKELSPIPFSSAVNYAKNKKYLPYLLFPLLIGIFILFASPGLLKESAERLFNPERKFTPQAPFTFELLNKSLKTAQYEDVEIKMRTKGQTIPEYMHILFGGKEIVMIRNKDNHFSYTLPRISKNTSFRFEANGFRSKEYTIQVLANPVLNGFHVKINYPSYTGKHAEILDNIGDLVVPEGSRVTWNFKTSHTDKVLLALGNHAFQPMPKTSENNFASSIAFYKDTTYKILLGNNQVRPKDTLQYRVSVIPDQYPSINVNHYNDSLTGSFALFTGEAGDDYGIASLSLNYSIQQYKGGTKNGRIPISIQKKNYTPFEYMLDTEDLGLQAGDKLSYYFIVCDNDGIHGGKCSKSQVWTFNKPTPQQRDSLLEKAREEIVKDLHQASKQNEKVDKDIDKMKEKILQKNNLDWEDKKRMEDIMQKNENIQQHIENIKNRFEKNNKQSEDKNYSDEIKDKQETLEKLMDQMQDKQFSERMKKIEELMKMLDKNRLFEELQKMQMDNVQMEKDIDRMMELLKQLERDMRMEDLANKAEKLAEKQQKLEEKNSTNQLSAQELKKEQDKLNNEMKELAREMKEIEKMNEESESKQDLDAAKQDQEDAEQNMQNSSDQLSQNQKQKSQQSQKKAAQSLQDMANKLRQMAGGGSMDQTEIDIAATRQILTNLLRMSFTQEQLIDRVVKTQISDPKYVENVQIQHRLREDSKMIADSLFTLSKRLFEISSFVNKETEEIKSRMQNSIRDLEGRNVRQASVEQQYVMTHTNNLALMLNELLDNLQKKQAQQQGMQGNGSCSKPGMNPGKGKGKGKGKGMGIGLQLQDIITQQQQLGAALDQLKGKMGKGGKEGEGKEGKNGKQGEGKSGTGGSQGSNGQSGGQSTGGQSEAEMMARLAARQSELRRQLEDIQNQLRKDGKSNPNLNKIKEDMDRNETDIVNKRITQDILQRQSEIVTRLLQAKDALREQDQGKERESQGGKELSREIPAELKEILKQHQHAVDYYKTIPADLNPYYKTLVEQYFGLIK